MYTIQQFKKLSGPSYSISGTFLGLIVSRLFHKRTVIGFFMGAVASLALAHESTGDVIIRQELDRMNREFPTIQFINLDDSKPDLYQSLSGKDAELLDYQHSPKNNEALRELNAARISMMIQNQIPSASLYRVGPHGLGKRPMLCVLTINPAAIMSTPDAASKFMLNVADQTKWTISPGAYLDDTAFLQHTVRHEVGHCIETMMMGGIPRVKRKYDAERSAYLSETWADMFATAVDLRTSGGTISLLDKLADYRSAGVVINGDFSHFTTYGIKYTVSMAKQFKGKRISQLANIIKTVFPKVAPSYAQYVKMHAYAMELQQRYEIIPDGNQIDMEFSQPSNRITSRMYSVIEGAYKRLFDQITVASAR